jgi:hypothetical protein
MTDEQRKKIRAERFGNNETSTAAAAARIQAEKAKVLERARRFGADNDELDEERRKQRAERFGVVTKESLEAKKLERMRRFGLDIKNNSANQKNGEKQAGKEAMQESLDAGKSQSELEAIRAARLARFGEVDPADLKQRGNKGESQDKDRRQKHRDRKRDRKLAAKQKSSDK